MNKVNANSRIFGSINDCSKQNFLQTVSTDSNQWSPLLSLSVLLMLCCVFCCRWPWVWWYIHWQWRHNHLPQLAQWLCPQPTVYLFDQVASGWEGISELHSHEPGEPQQLLFWLCGGRTWLGFMTWFTSWNAFKYFSVFSMTNLCNMELFISLRMSVKCMGKVTVQLVHVVSRFTHHQTKCLWTSSAWLKD